MEYAIYCFLSKLLTAIGMESEHIPIRRHRLAGLDVCDVTMDELDVIEREGSNVGLDFQIMQWCLAVSLSFLATLLTVKVDSPRVFTVFVVIVVAGAFVGISFGLKWFQSRGVFKESIQRIRDRQVGTVGEQGKELKVSDLASLPGQTAPPIVTESVAAAANLSKVTTESQQPESKAK